MEVWAMQLDFTGVAHDVGICCMDGSGDVRFGIAAVEPLGQGRCRFKVIKKHLIDVVGELQPFVCWKNSGLKLDFARAPMETASGVDSRVRALQGLCNLACTGLSPKVHVCVGGDGEWHLTAYGESRISSDVMLSIPWTDGVKLASELSLDDANEVLGAYGGELSHEHLRAYVYKCGGVDLLSKIVVSAVGSWNRLDSV